MSVILHYVEHKFTPRRHSLLQVRKILKVEENILTYVTPFQGGGSDEVSVSCFGVRVSVMFHFMFVHYTFSSVWVAEWPPFGK